MTVTPLSFAVHLNGTFFVKKTHQLSRTQPRDDFWLGRCGDYYPKQEAVLREWPWGEVDEDDRCRACDHLERLTPTEATA